MRIYFQGQQTTDLTIPGEYTFHLGTTVVPLFLKGTESPEVLQDLLLQKAKEIQPVYQEGLMWLHVEGPDGPDTLLASFAQNFLTFPCAEGGVFFFPEERHFHKWFVIYAEPVHIPIPFGVTS